MERKSRAQTESFVFLAVVVVALVLVNVLAIRFFARWDLTKRQLYTLSDGTRRIVGGLHDQLTVTVYFTPNQPPPANDDERFLRDQLDEYRSISHGHVSVHFVATDTDARRHDADAAGCTKQALQSVDVNAQQAQVMEVYRCVSFEYLGRRDKIEFLPPGVQGLEYEISSIVKNLTTPEAQRERTIGFLTGHGELTPEEGMQFLPQVMEQERITYHTRAINLSNGDQAVPTDIKGLIIANPQRQLNDRELRRLDEYLMHGGSIALFAGGVNFGSTDPTQANGTASENHLNDWLDGYGIHINTDVVLDPRSTDASVRIGRQGGRVRLLTWPAITAISGQPSESDLRTLGGLDPSFPAVFRLPEFVAPYPSSITLNSSARTTAGGTAQIFARSGPRSIQRTSDFDLNIIELLQRGRELFENASQHGPYTVGVSLSGRFRSAFAGHAPAASADGGAPAVPTNSNVPERAEHDARLLVISAGNVFSLDTLRTLAQISGGARPANLTLLFNTFDWLSQDMDLLAVRAKDTSEPQLRADVSNGAKAAFQWGAILVLPLAIGAIGLAITSMRRKRRKDYNKVYGPQTGTAKS